MSGHPLVVLHTLRAPVATVGYVDLVVEATPPGTRLRFFDWGTALLGRYDVLHLHWPELLVRDSRRPWLRAVRRRLLDVLVLRLALTRTPLVWTVHNPAPHERGPRPEQRSLARLERRVDLVVRLSPAGPAGPAAGRAGVTIPHAHYRNLLGRAPRPEREPGRLLHFGIIRPYKGVGALVAAFSAMDDPDAATGPPATLRVVGHPHPGQAEVVRAACARDPRISATLRHVGDDDLVAEVSRAQVVVLPYLGRMNNSGAVVAALSLERPVLVPRSATNAALAAEVGQGWVHQYDGPLTAEVLRAALVATATPPAERPRLDARDPEVQRGLYRQAYQRALAARGARRRHGAWAR